MDPALQGFLTGAALILAIGAQNAFVLRQGLRGQHVFAVCTVCVLSDAALITAGVAGLEALSRAAPGLEPVIRYAGAAFLILYGAIAARAAWRGGGGLDAARGTPTALWPVLLSCLALTWLNPHVYLDVLVLGSVALQSASPVRFAVGAIAASAVFFFALGYGAALLRPAFASPAMWRGLDGTVAAVMWAIAAGLILGR